MVVRQKKKKAYCCNKSVILMSYKVLYQMNMTFLSKKDDMKQNFL